jgi:hypothetical protein
VNRTKKQKQKQKKKKLEKVQPANSLLDKQKTTARATLS